MVHNAVSLLRCLEVEMSTENSTRSPITARTAGMALIAFSVVGFLLVGRFGNTDSSKFGSIVFMFILFNMFPTLFLLGISLAAMNRFRSLFHVVAILLVQVPSCIILSILFDYFNLS